MSNNYSNHLGIRRVIRRNEPTYFNNNTVELVTELPVLRW